MTTPSDTLLSKTIAWLLCRPEIDEARKAAARSPRQETLIERASSALAAASVLSEVPESPGQATPRHASVLYHEALYWALLASKPDLEEPEMDALWEAASAVTSELALGETEKADMARVVAMKRPAVALAELPSEEQAALSRLLQRVSETAIAIVNRQKVAVQRLSVKRFLRVVSAFVVVVGLVFALIAMIPKPRPPAGSDLAKTAAWTTSSKLADCDPVAGQCAGAKTKIFFHTNEDDSPWVEYDLGRPTEIKAIIVTNRQDGLPDRAVPLVAEVSDDQKTYRELGRQETTFTVWEPKFEKQKTRYVRLRVARKTYFHLEAVEIR